MATIRKSKGQPRVFTDEQNAVLHAALAELQGRKKRSQRELGELLGIGQQAAGRLEKFEDAGFSRVSASALVRALGYAGVDTFFRSRGVTDNEQPHAKSA